MLKTATPALDDDKQFIKGSDIYTYSRLSGVVNHRDKKENSVEIQLDQFGFLSHKEDATKEMKDTRPFHFAFSEFHKDKENLATKESEQIIKNEVDTTENITTLNLGMSPTIILNRGEDVNIKAQTHFGGNMDFFLTPSSKTLPAGLSFSQETGSISGSPTEKTTTPLEFTITARNPWEARAMTLNYKSKIGW